MGEESKQEKVFRMFRQLDEDGDGKLELGDLKRVLKVLDADFWDPERVERLFEQADNNKDGRIDAGDFISWLFADGLPPELMPPELDRGVTRLRFFEASSAC